MVVGAGRPCRLVRCCASGGAVAGQGFQALLTGPGCPGRAGAEDASRARRAAPGRAARSLGTSKRGHRGARGGVLPGDDDRCRSIWYQPRPEPTGSKAGGCNRLAVLTVYRGVSGGRPLPPQCSCRRWRGSISDRTGRCQGSAAATGRCLMCDRQQSKFNDKPYIAVDDNLPGPLSRSTWPSRHRPAGVRWCTRHAGRTTAPGPTGQRCTAPGWTRPHPAAPTSSCPAPPATAPPGARRCGSTTIRLGSPTTRSTSGWLLTLQTAR